MDHTAPYYGWLNTPIGWLKVAANEQGITAVDFVDQQPVLAAQINDVVAMGLEQLKLYFDGRLQRFELPLAATGTEFRQQVWHCLTGIEYGQTASYSDIANAIARPKAVRAVGTANGANPIAIVVPCHRVIGKNGTLTGYAGGLNRKQWLLDLEQSVTKDKANER